MDTLFIPLMEQLLHQTGLLDITPGNIVMIITGMVLLYLGIVKKYEPFLLVGIGFSCIVANIPGSTLTKEGGLFWYSYQGVENLIDFCMNHQLSMTNLLLLGIRTYLSKVNNGQEDITIQNFISRRSTHDEWTSGGSRTIMFPCRTVIAPETDFLSAAYEIQNMQNRIYMHSNYDPAFIMDEMRKRYNTPEHTGYESCYLTYQPMTVKVENEMLGTIRQHAKWFANGAATKKMYLTVSHTEDGGMNFSYHYQTAHLEEHDMELLYYYMMRILFKGIAEPDMSIGEIMELV